MKTYLVKITRYWEREVEANSMEEAQSVAYDDIEDFSGDDFDEVEIECLSDDEDEDE